MARTIGTILTLRDRISSPLVRVSRNVQDVTREMRQAQNQVVRFSSNTVESMDEIVKSTVKAGLAMGSLVGGLATKIGFSEAMNLEGYKTQLETATKDTQKAGEIMKYAVNLANKTPFETGSMVEAAAKLEAMGMSAQKYLPSIADMAGATNKSLDQANEAIIDAQTGELERLKEFGITKQMIIDHGNKITKGKQLVNNKGQIVDQENFNKTLFDLMETKFKGGAEKQSKTFKGMWSTVTGVTKTALASIVGMQEDGTIRQGSLFERLKNKIQVVADTLQKWQQDGTITKIGTKVTSAVSKMIIFFKSLFSFIREHEKVISSVMVFVGAIYATIKVIGILKTVMAALNVIWLIFNGTLTLSPLGWIVLAIGAVITIGYALWRNWDMVKNKAKDLWSGIKTTFKAGANFVIDIINKLVDAVNKVKINIPDWVPGIGGKTLGFNIEKISKFHMDSRNVRTSRMQEFANGGIANKPSIFGEVPGVPEMAIPLKKNNKRSQQLLNQADSIVSGGSRKDVNIQINIDTFIGTEEFVDMIGDRVNRKVTLALANLP